MHGREEEGRGAKRRGIIALSSGSGAKSTDVSVTRLE